MIEVVYNSQLSVNFLGEIWDMNYSNDSIYWDFLHNVQLDCISQIEKLIYINWCFFYRATSTTNVHLADTSNYRHSSDHVESNLGRKRATSAHGLDRKPEGECYLCFRF